jgi:hypothetical protein
VRVLRAYTRRFPLTHLPADSVVAELLVVSVITILWIPYMYALLSSPQLPLTPSRSLRTIHHRHHTSLFHTFVHSLLGLFLLTIAFLAGAGVANKYWAHLGWCWTYHACRILTVLLAFAWGAGILSAILFLIDLVWVARHRAWRQPMHGYYEQERKGWFRR